MGTITGLGIILLILMIIVGGQQGWRSFVSLLLNFCYFYLSLVLVAWHFSPFIITPVVSIVILATTIFIGTEDWKVGVSAFEAATIVLVVTMLLTLLVEYMIQATGFSVENSNELEGMSIFIGISYVQIGMMTTIMSCLGAIAEAAIAIVSGLRSVMVNDPSRNGAQLFNAGMRMGKHIIGTTLNTLLLGFMGSFLALFVWFFGLHYSFGMIMNNKIMVAELATILISFIGVILTVPLSALIVCWNQKKD